MSKYVRNSVGQLSAPAARSGVDRKPESLVAEAAEKMLNELPNDLTRLIYLTSLRDYNSGTYLHAELSRRYNVGDVDHILKLYHAQVFDQLLESPVCAYVDQLKMYIAFAGVSRAEFLRTWKQLKAYNSAIPLDCDALAAEVFAVNIISALSLLEQVGE